MLTSLKRRPHFTACGLNSNSPRQQAIAYHSVIILSKNLLEGNTNFLDLQNFLCVAVSCEEGSEEVAVDGDRQGACAGPGGSTGIIVGLNQHL